MKRRDVAVWGHSHRGGGGVFSYIRRLGQFLGIQHFDFQDFVFCFQKNDFLGGYEDCMGIFGRASQNGLFLGSFLWILGSFL